jgi:hypothetical protein
MLLISSLNGHGFTNAGAAEQTDFSAFQRMGTEGQQP